MKADFNHNVNKSEIELNDNILVLLGANKCFIKSSYKTKLKS